MSQVESRTLTASAGRNFTGIGAIILNESDLTLSAVGTVTFDAEQNQKYLTQSGWSFGWGFKGSDFLETLATKGGQDAFQQYVQSNPLAAVHALAANKGRGINEWLNVGLTTARTLTAADQEWKTQGSVLVEGTSMGGAILNQLNPFPSLKDAGKSCAGSPSACAFAMDVSFRFQAWTNEQTWTESNVSKLFAGGDVVVQAGQDLALVGGTVLSASHNLTLKSGRDTVITALADTSTSKSSNWGESLSLSPTGVTVGGNVFQSKSASLLYSNSSVTAGHNLVAVSARDMRIAGANMLGSDVAINVGRDLTVASRQNQSDSNSWGFNFSVTVAPNGTPTGGSLGGSLGQSSRLYTDTPTTIIAEDRLDAYVGNTTFLLGAAISSKAGKLKLDTENFVFDHYGDKEFEQNVALSLSLPIVTDKAGNKSVDLSSSDRNGSYYYHNKEGLTYATVGAGEIIIRNTPNGAGTSLLGLNRDIKNVQRVVRNDTINIKIPTLNLQKVLADLKTSYGFLRALVAETPANAKNMGPEGVYLFKRLVESGISFDEADALTRSELFAAIVHRSQSLAGARAAGHKLDFKDLILLDKG